MTIDMAGGRLVADRESVCPSLVMGGRRTRTKVVAMAGRRCHHLLEQTNTIIRFTLQDMYRTTVPPCGTNTETDYRTTSHGPEQGTSLQDICIELQYHHVEPIQRQTIGPLHMDHNKVPVYKT